MDTTLVEPLTIPVEYETDEPVLYRVEAGVAWLTLNRPKYNNAQNFQMLYALDDAFARAAQDDAVKVIVLGAAGKHFSAGHDIGTPGRDVHVAMEKPQSLWYRHENKPHAEAIYAREQEIYLHMCRRWRDMPKPSIAMVQGACIAGGLMLAWVCDLIVASDDAYFQDPVVRMGVPGVEYFAHPFELPPRIAKEMLLLGTKIGAERAYGVGMVNAILPRDALDAGVKEMAEKMAQQPRLGMALTKLAVNHAEDAAGKRVAMDGIFHMHHFSHAQNNLVSGHLRGGEDAKSMAKANREG